jgi:hypothetical protein
VINVSRYFSIGPCSEHQPILLVGRMSNNVCRGELELGSGWFVLAGTQARAGTVLAGT